MKKSMQSTAFTGLVAAHPSRVVAPHAGLPVTQAAMPRLAAPTSTPTSATQGTALSAFGTTTGRSAVVIDLAVANPGSPPPRGAPV